MDGGAWWATLLVHGAPKSWTRLSDFTFFFSTWEAQLSPPATTTELPGHNQRARAPQVSHNAAKIPGTATETRCSQIHKINLF